MVTRNDPFGSFNFLVKLGNAGGEDQIAGGFSEVSGLGDEITYVEYRNGNDKENHTRKIPSLHKTSDVVLKRGLIGDLRLFDWLKATREGTIDRRTVTITLLDEARSPVCSFVLRNAQPRRWLGPVLTAKGGGEVAMEELHLVAESIEYVSK